MSSIDPTVVETLLNMSENDMLDFKRDQYPFSSATDEEKSELVKDIVSFANGWKTGDAFILVGVDENPGGRATVVGITDHINDADLQQLLLGKTTKPVAFEYVPMIVDGKAVGVIRIRKDQDRPVCLRKAFGKLKPNVVYMRHGSTTKEATPDDIARMGEARVSVRQEPTVTLEWGDVAARTTLGPSVRVISKILREPPLPPSIPRRPSRGHSSPMDRVFDPYPPLGARDEEVEDGSERSNARVPERRVRGMTRVPAGGFLPERGAWS